MNKRMTMLEMICEYYKKEQFLMVFEGLYDLNSFAFALPLHSFLIFKYEIRRL